MFKPVDQTVFGPMGNCQSACIASILGIPLRDIPNFWYMGDTPQACYAALREWLHERGWTILTFPVHDPGVLTNYIEGYLIIGGRTSGGLEHSTIWHKGKMVHDPHPDRKGLTEITQVDILYPLEPWRWKWTIQRRANQHNKEI